LQNFNIYSGLNPSLGPKTVTFVGHDENGISVTYRLRTPTEQHATELKDAMNREIAFVKGDSE
jgi:nucleoporin NUP2